MERKILFSIMLIAVIALLTGAGTYAYFSDSEGASDNTFESGTLNLQVGNTDPCEGSISIDGLKPGDNGNAISWLIINNGSIAGDLSINISTITSNENTLYEIETGTGDNSAIDGELETFLMVAIWMDNDTSNTWNAGDYYLEAGGTKVPYSSGSLPVEAYNFLNSYESDSWADVQTNLSNGDIGTLNIEYDLPYHVNINQVQSDSCTFDIIFTLQQWESIVSLTMSAPVLSVLSDNRKYAAPSEEWNETFGGASSDYAYSLKQTNDGGYIIAGDAGSFGGGYHNAWLIKTDLNGSEDWNNTFGGTSSDYAYSVQQTSDSGYILAGKTSSFGEGSSNAWLIKTDLNGIEEWNNTFGGSIDNYARSVMQTSDGGYIFAGRTSDLDESYQFIDYAWLVKTDESGNHLWNQTFGGTGSDYAYSVMLTDDGGYIIAGKTSSFGEGPSDAWLIKTDPNGNEEWNNTFDGYDGSYSDEVHSAKQTSDGGYIVAGEKTNLGGSISIWLIKTDTNGNAMWNKTFGTTQSGKSYDVCQTKDGSYIVVGNTESPIESYTYDGFIIKTDNEGNELWNKTLGGTSDDYIYSVIVTDEEEILVAGETTPIDSWYTDGWIAKLGLEPLLIGINESELLTITLNATDIDGDSISYSTNATFGTLVENVFTWTPGTGEIGVYGVEFTASDGQLSDTENVTITVNDIV